MILFSDQFNQTGEFPLGKAESDDTTILAAIAGIDLAKWELAIGSCRFPQAMSSAMEHLVEDGSDPNIFFDPLFLSASQERLGLVDKKLLTLFEEIGSSRQLKLAMPVQLEKCGLPGQSVLRVWSHPYGPLSTPLTDKADLPEIIDRLAGVIPEISLKTAKAIVFQDLPLECSFAREIQANKAISNRVQICCRYRRAALLPGNGDKYPRSHLSTRRAKEIERQYRRLSELGDLELKITTEFGDALVRFEEFLLLETKSWKGRRGTSIYTIKKTAAFARQAVANLIQAGRCRIYTLRLDDRAIASVIVFRSGQYHFPWKMAFDEEFAAYSPGKQLIVEMTRKLLNEPGFAGADSLAAPDNHMINQLWPDRLKMGAMVIGTGEDGVKNTLRVASALERYQWLRSTAKKLLKKYL